MQNCECDGFPNCECAVNMMVCSTDNLAPMCITSPYVS